ncbi:MAG: hypothetical protein ACFFAN_14385 [Promethearchaeota archaeon]
MVLFQLTVTRFTQVYIAQGIVFVFFIYLIYKVLKTDRNKLKIIFCGYYISEAIGIFINFIYAPLTNPDLVKILNFLTNFFIIFGTIFFMVFCLISFKGEEKLSPPKQLLIILSYGVVLSFMIFIPEGVEINADTGWLPHWSLTLFIYVMVVMTIFAVAPSFYYAIKIYQIIDDELLKKKWKFFIIGLIKLNIFLYGTFFSNTLHNPTFRIIWALISLYLALSGSYLVYYGVGSKLKRI